MTNLGVSFQELMVWLWLSLGSARFMVFCFWLDYQNIRMSGGLSTQSYDSKPKMVDINPENWG